MSAGLNDSTAVVWVSEGGDNVSRIDLIGIAKITFEQVYGTNVERVVK